MQRNKLLDKIKKTVTEKKLISKGDKILIGLSGGADSVCLTHALYTLSKDLGFTVFAAHLNHHIRGAEADNDADFAREFSNSLGIKFILGNADVPSYAKAAGISEEEAGRELRYAFFYDAAQSEGFTKIATAHNRNDNAETIAMNFMRGTSIKGLSGIPYRRGNVIRPILDITRAEVEEYCKASGLEYVTDSTNLADDYTRNKIRHSVIPLIEEFNPNFINTVSKNAEIIKSEEDYTSREADKAYNALFDGYGIEVSGLFSCHIAIARRIIRKMIGNVLDIRYIASDFTDDIIALARENQSGKSINLPKNSVARIEYGKLIIDKADEPIDYEYKIPLNTDVYIKEAGITLRFEIANERKNDGAQYFSGVDIDSIAVRNRRNGDCFYPAGMGGRKKLKDYFIDEKISRGDRQKLPIVTFNGEIGYIIGYRRDERFKFTGKGIKIINI